MKLKVSEINESMFKKYNSVKCVMNEFIDESRARNTIDMEIAKCFLLHLTT